MDNNIFQKIKKYIQYDRLIIDAILLSIVWILLILLVNPVGDFPLNDDWVFTKFVKIFIEQHYIKLSDGIYMTLISNILWGGLFSSIFGFSYFSLRISSLVVS